MADGSEALRAALTAAYVFVEAERRVCSDSSLGRIIDLSEQIEAALAAPTPEPGGGVWERGWQAGAEAMQRKAASYAENACLVPPDGGDPTSAEVEVCDEAARRIRAISFSELSPLPAPPSEAQP